jgi:hypothetical protein
MAKRTMVLSVVILATLVSSVSAKELRWLDPTAAVTVFDFGSRIDDNGRNGK